MLGPEPSSQCGARMTGLRSRLNDQALITESENSERESAPQKLAGPINPMEGHRELSAGRLKSLRRISAFVQSPARDAS